MAVNSRSVLAFEPAQRFFLSSHRFKEKIKFSVFTNRLKNGSRIATFFFFKALFKLF